MQSRENYEQNNSFSIQVRFSVILFPLKLNKKEPSLTLCSHYCFLVFDEKKMEIFQNIQWQMVTSSLCILQLKNVWFFLAYRRISVRDVMSEREQRKMQTICKQITVNRCRISERGIIRILPRIQKVNKRSFGWSQFICFGFLFLNLIADRNNTSLITFSW